jgi:hypothetical protein
LCLTDVVLDFEVNVCLPEESLVLDVAMLGAFRVVVTLLETLLLLVLLLVLLTGNDSECSVDGVLQVDVAESVLEVVLAFKWLDIVVRVTIELELAFLVELDPLLEIDLSVE